MSERILIVEDDKSFAARLVKNLSRAGFATEVAYDVDQALAILADQSFNLVLADIKMPGRTGLELLDEINALGAEGEGPAMPVIILTSIGDAQTAVEAMQRGASDYLQKQMTSAEIVIRIERTMGQGRLAGEVRQLRRTLDRYTDFNEIIGDSDCISKLKEQIAEVAPSEATVLVMGETGVGKELVARAIHRASPRADGPFIEVNCAALPDENLFLSELFGHERGAFTGALARKRGHFELAEGGTLFLDEIGEMGPMAQARLLRAVETLQFNRVGGERPIQADCRLVFATNKNLTEEVETGEFRRDLYYRINVCPIEPPPLRAHPEDIPALARFFVARVSEKHRTAPITFSDAALEALKANPWPGNVRELGNVIERLSIRFAGRGVEPENLTELNLAGGSATPGAIILPEGGVDLLAVEKSLVVQALKRTEGSQRKAAELLGISVDRMNARVKKFKLTHPSWRVHRPGGE